VVAQSSNAGTTANGEGNEYCVPMLNNVPDDDVIGFDKEILSIIEGILDIID